MVEVTAVYKHRTNHNRPRPTHRLTRVYNTNLLNKYEWKLPKISSQKFNIKIQEICKDLKIDSEIKKVSYMGKNHTETILPKWKLIGSHTARRTFITLMSERGMPDHQLMQIAGIKDVKTLIKYKKFKLKTLIKTSNKLWD